MGVTFFNPLLLLGLAAAILPVLIHRITRKKAVVRKFAAVHLLMQSQLITARPQRLKHLLLLALRMLAVAGIVLMMARPVLVRTGFAALPGNGARVIMVDNSASMGFREDQGRRFDRARRGAAAALKNFGGRVLLIPTVPAPSTTAGQWLTAPAAEKALAALPLASGSGDPVAAFAQAYRQLENLNVPKQILVFSDMARGDWEGLNAARVGVVSDADVTFFRIGGAGRDPNFCVRSVSLAAGDITAGVPAALEVRVSNPGADGGRVQVGLFLDGQKVDGKGVDLAPGTDASVVFDLLIENPGWVDGEIRLGEDRLAADDVFYFPLQAAEPVKVLLVDGDPTAALKAGESFYLGSALRPGGMEKAPFRVRVVTTAELARLDLMRFDVLGLLNVARPDFSRPAAFLQAGRPVFMFLGDRIDPEAYNQFALAPWRIRGRVERRDPAEAQGRIDRVDAGLSFPTALDASLKGALFQDYYRVEGAGQALLTLQDRQPLLLAADAGRSRLYLFTSSADLDWNDLPLQAAYVPLVQGLFRSAAGRAGTSLPAGVPWGAPWPADGPAAGAAERAVDPGIYRFVGPEGEYRRGVNVPRTESDLVKVSEAGLRKKFGPLTVGLLTYSEDTFAKQQGGRRELWPLLLGVILAVLAVEMIVAGGFRPFAAGRFKSLRTAQWRKTV